MPTQAQSAALRLCRAAASMPALRGVFVLAAALVLLGAPALAQRGGHAAAPPRGGGAQFRVPQRSQPASRPSFTRNAPAQNRSYTAQQQPAFRAPESRNASPVQERPAGSSAQVFRNGQPHAAGQENFAPIAPARPNQAPAGPQMAQARPQQNAPQAVPGGGVPRTGIGSSMYERRQNGGPVIQRGNAGNPGHLGQWMQQHQGQSAEQQQQALKREPGFDRLPSEQQQRLQQRLQQLNRMPAQDRQRTLGYVEGMERLNPQQRGQVNSALGGFHQLPQDQRQQVGRAFNQIRRLPPEQRAGAVQSYAGQMNAQQQQSLNNLLRAEPYLPLQR